MHGKETLVIRFYDARVVSFATSLKLYIRGVLFRGAIVSSTLSVPGVAPTLSAPPPAVLDGVLKCI